MSGSCILGTTHTCVKVRNRHVYSEFKLKGYSKWIRTGEPNNAFAPKCRKMSQGDASLSNALVKLILLFCCGSKILN